MTSRALSPMVRGFCITGSVAHLEDVDTALGRIHKAVMAAVGPHRAKVKSQFGGPARCPQVDVRYSKLLHKGKGFGVGQSARRRDGSCTNQGLHRRVVRGLSERGQLSRLHEEVNLNWVFRPRGEGGYADIPLRE
jgi:hypothetical protein